MRGEALDAVADVLCRWRTELAAGRLLGIEDELSTLQLEALRAFACGPLEP